MKSRNKTQADNNEIAVVPFRLKGHMLAKTNGCFVKGGKGGRQLLEPDQFIAYLFY